MLLFIGGAARTGKSMLVRRLLTEMQMSYLNLDVLKMGLVRGVPEYAIDPNAGAVSVAERLWPLIFEMSMSLIHDNLHYAFEGELLPKHVAALRQMYPSHVKACFLGYTSIAPEQKLLEIRAHGHHPNNWAIEYEDEALRNIIIREIAFSHYVMNECVAHQIPYFDTSQNFLQTLDQVVAYVRAE